MVILGGWVLLMSEEPLQRAHRAVVGAGLPGCHLLHCRASDEAGFESGYGHRLPPYGTPYRRAPRTTRTRLRTRTQIWAAPFGCRCWASWAPSFARPRQPGLVRVNSSRARPLLVGTPERSKTPKLLRTFSQLGQFVPGIPLN